MTMRKILAPAVATIAILAMGAECSPESTKVLLPRIGPTFHLLDFAAGTGSSISIAAHDLAGVADDATAIKGKLDTIASSDRPFGQALTTATCEGFNQIASKAETQNGKLLLPDEEEWRKFLQHALTVAFPVEASSAINRRVNAFVTTAQLTRVNPQLARSYVRVCFAPGR
jgi:hypothetical protein